jgi:hypothetical protein
MKALYFVPIRKSIWSPTRGRPHLILSDIEDCVSDKTQSTLFRILHDFQGCFVFLVEAHPSILQPTNEVQEDRIQE